MAAMPSAPCEVSEKCSEWGPRGRYAWGANDENRSAGATIGRRIDSYTWEDREHHVRIIPEHVVSPETTIQKLQWGVENVCLTLEAPPGASHPGTWTFALWNLAAPIERAEATVRKERVQLTLHKRDSAPWPSLTDPRREAAWSDGTDASSNASETAPFSMFDTEESPFDAA